MLGKITILLITLILCASNVLAEDINAILSGVLDQQPVKDKIKSVVSGKSSNIISSLLGNSAGSSSSEEFNPFLGNTTDSSAKERTKTGSSSKSSKHSQNLPPIPAPPDSKYGSQYTGQGNQEQQQRKTTPWRILGRVDDKVSITNSYTGAITLVPNGEIVDGCMIDYPSVNCEKEQYAAVKAKQNVTKSQQNLVVERTKLASEKGLYDREIQTIKKERDKALQTAHEVVATAKGERTRYEQEKREFEAKLIALKAASDNAEKLRLELLAANKEKTALYAAKIALQNDEIAARSRMERLSSELKVANENAEKIRNELEVANKNAEKIQKELYLAKKDKTLLTTVKSDFENDEIEAKKEMERLVAEYAKLHKILSATATDFETVRKHVATLSESVKVSKSAALAPTLPPSWFSDSRSQRYIEESLGELEVIIDNGRVLAVKGAVSNIATLDSALSKYIIGNKVVAGGYVYYQVNGLIVKGVN